MDGYSLKEMLDEVRSDNKAALSTQGRILTTLENIDAHLGKLNSKVAAHEKKINGLESFQTKAMVVWSFVVFVVVTVVNKVVNNL